MLKVNIGGVPEHFNLAWYLTLKDGAYKKAGINLRWQDFPGGTGAMCKALRSAEIDLAVVLTEGIISDIIAGNPSKILQVFVKSPLIWGIHVANKSPFSEVIHLRGKKAAISRYGSGSHLMTYVHAQSLGWDLDNDLKFEVIRNLDGAVLGLTNGVADYFLWEKFTTKPLVDAGVFRRIGECPTPWPCFVIAAREEFIASQPEAIKTILEIINTTTEEFKFIPSIDRTIANRYDQEIEDVREWLSLTSWDSQNLKPQILDKIQDQLLALDIIPRKASQESILYELF